MIQPLPGSAPAELAQVES